MPNKSNWDSYQSCTISAKISRDCAVHFARREDWTPAFAHAASAKTMQTKADEYFEDYLDELALAHAFEYAERRRKARALAGVQNRRECRLSTP